jgi:Tfp pilus assembly protein PilX
VIRSGKQTGYILLPVIVVITVVAAIALLMNAESALESNTAGSELDAQQAQYVAEAGLSHALWLAQQQGCGPYSNLTDEPLGNDKYTTNLTTDLGSTTSYTIAVDQDSWIRSDQPTVNKATDLKLHTRNEAAATERPLLRYDLSPIAAGASVLSATAWFYVTDAHAAGPIDIHLTSADWTETDATWDSMSTNMDSVILATIPSQPVTGIWLPVNLTAQVQAWVNGQPNFGITLNSTADGVHGQYSSRESANPPYLEVIVGTPPTSPATLKADGMLANGVQRSIKRQDVTLRQHPAGYSLSRVTTGSGQDAMLDSFYNSRNFGDHELKLEVRSTFQNSLIQFELPAIAPGARIVSAQLELYHYITSGTPVNPGADVHRVTRSWVEGTQSGSGTADGASWDTWNGSSNWTSAGGDYDATPVASSAISAATGDWENWEITELVQGWIDGRYPNHGLFLKGTGSIDDISFASKEDANAALHPKLSITYTCACGEVCVAPEGNLKVLMVVGDDDAPTPGDLAKKELMESWGYTVDLVNDNTSESALASAMITHDVLYVAASADEAAVGTKLTGLAAPVVNEVGALADEIGFATGASSAAGDATNIVDSDHYITLPFAAGPLTLYNANMAYGTLGGTLAPDLRTLAAFGADSGLAILDSGSQLASGGSAPARRVMLPFAAADDFNWDYLNANGRLLLQRALAWGAGAAVTSAGNVLLVVVDPGSLTAQEDAKKALIESWGYTVNLIDESDSQANFDAAAAANDVAYIPQDITSSNLGTKLRDAAIGVVNEEGEQVDELGISQDKLFKSRHEIDVINNTHYITQPFATGLLIFTSSDQSVHMLAANQAPGLLTLGQSFNTGSIWEPSLAVIKTGDDLWGGGTAAGRRVELPWGGGTFDINQLTDDGRTIMQRAIEWGAGVGCASSKPLLLVVGDAATLSSKDAGMKILMESWCYAVTVIDDGDSQANFDAAAAAAEVVYVSGTTSGPALLDKLTGSPTPIVNEINGKLDNFGFSSSTASSVTASAFSATNASHYISEPFSGNPVTFFTTDLAMPVPGGTLAPGLQTVGETTGAIAALVTLDSGAQRWDGNPAPARRVHLPFTNAEPSQLTADGEILMQRAIEWAGGVDIDTGPIAHWKLDDGTGLDAIDSVGGHDGTLNGVPAWVVGNLGDALDFDGSNDYVDLTSDAELDDVFVGGATVMAWIEPRSWGGNGYGRIFDKSSVAASTGDGWAIRLNKDNGGLNFGQGFTGGRGWWRFAESSINFNTWHHVALAYDASSTTNDPIVYLDGSPVAVTRVDTPSGDVRSDAAINLRLGSHASSTFNVFDGKIDDARIYDRMLSAAEIADIAAEGDGAAGGASYTELYQPWSATSADTWQTVDLGAFGVPANAVVEVAVTNTDTGRENFGGVRAVGSSLERRFALHEAESGGVDAVTMHVQTDASSQIQHYADRTDRIIFILLGYWTGASYVERFDAFKAGANASWQPHDLGTYGVGPNQVAEIALSQTSTSIEWLVGARQPGSGLTRLLPLHEAQGGGIDMVTLMAGTDASSMVEVFAEANTVVDFHLLGYWSTPPGTYTETGGVHGQATVAGSWLTTDLSSFGIPADSVAQFVMSNERDANENLMGVRATGSTIPDRRLDLQEAESGGGDLGTMHVQVDASSQIQWSAEYGATEGFFYPVGWWVLSP